LEHIGSGKYFGDTGFKSTAVECSIVGWQLIAVFVSNSNWSLA
jgi:hypothetical protein